MKTSSRTAAALAGFALAAWAAGARAQQPASAEAAPKAEAKNAAAPKIAIENELVDAGDVVRGGTATATFVVRNTGNEPLKILSAKPG